MAAVKFRKATYEKFIATNIIVEKDCVCFILRKNPRKNFYIIGDGESTFIELAKPSPLIVIYTKIKLYLKKKRENNES